MFAVIYIKLYSNFMLNFPLHNIHFLFCFLPISIIYIHFIQVFYNYYCISKMHFSKPLGIIISMLKKILFIKLNFYILAHYIHLYFEKFLGKTFMYAQNYLHNYFSSIHLQCEIIYFHSI